MDNEKANVFSRDYGPRSDEGMGALIGAGKPQVGGIQGLPNPILKFFNYSHLPTRLQPIAQQMHGVAHLLNDAMPDSAEKSAGLRKLLEAKDCFVRAAME